MKMSAKVMIKKEFNEIFKTSKIFILPLILLFFGFSSPILTKMMPELLSGLMDEMQIILPDQTWMDSYIQFFGNITQIGFIAIILVFMNTITEEKSKNTIILVLSKPISRTWFIMSKFIVNSIFLNTSILISYFATAFYTNILFENTQYSQSLQAISLFMIYSTGFLAIVTGLSAILKSSLATGGISLGIFALVSASTLFGKFFAENSPGAIPGHMNKLITGQINFNDTIMTIFLTILLSFGILIFGIIKFNKLEI